MSKTGKQHLHQPDDALRKAAAMPAEQRCRRKNSPVNHGKKPWKEHDGGKYIEGMLFKGKRCVRVVE